MANLFTAVRKWAIASPLNTFLFLILWDTILFLLWQLIFNPMEFIHDPWGVGGLIICFLVGLPTAFAAAIYFWWQRRRQS